jgi:hypothetical protein
MATKAAARKPSKASSNVIEFDTDAILAKEKAIAKETDESISLDRAI